MAPPGGGRNPIGARVQACFSTLNFAAPSDAQLRRIFSTLLSAKLADFDDEVRGTSAGSQLDLLSSSCYRESERLRAGATPGSSHHAACR